jgi:hypothetical protein
LRGNGIPYQGINVLMLWSAAIENGYAAPIANLVIWPTVFEKQQRIILSACLMAVYGRIQREPTAESVEYMVVVADDLIAESRATCSGRSRPILFALSSPLRRVMC